MTMPLKVTPRLEERINARWLFWSPWMLSLARKRLPHISLDTSMNAARQQHRTRYLDALTHRLPEATIKRRNLDDPRLHQDEYRIRVENCLRKRACQLGLRRGVRRTHKEIMANVTNK